MDANEYAKRALLNALADRICLEAGINPLTKIDMSTEECDETDAINLVIDKVVSKAMEGP